MNRDPEDGDVISGGGGRDISGGTDRTPTSEDRYPTYRTRGEDGGRRGVCTGGPCATVITV